MALRLNPSDSSQLISAMAASLSSVALPSFPPSCQHDHRATAITPRRSLLKCFLRSEKLSDPLHICRVLPKAPSDPVLFDEGRLDRERYGGLADLDGHGGARPDVRLPERRLSDVWREIHGQDDWAGMLDPMDPLLRSELVRYGEMAQACYDAFDFDPFSKYCGSCRYAKQEFFERLDLDMKGRTGYDVTRYLYATSNINLPNFFKKSRWPKVWSKHANWIGYVAVSDDETTRRLGRRDVAVAWRGTVTRLEWVADLMDYLVPVSSQKVPCPDPGVKAESGFLCLYTDKEDDCKFSKYSAREQILTEVKRLIEKYPDDHLSITMTGHSLGSALAILSAYDIAETGINVRRDSRAIPVCVFSFAGPRVGNTRFKERAEALGVKVLRVVNVHDVVPKSPGLVFNERSPQAVMRIAGGLPWSYSHVGVELELDHEHSPFLKPTGDPACAHNLEAHLHLLDGYHGKGQRFVLASGRDPALVNKDGDFLKDHHLVPPFWRQVHNKGLVRNHDGRWMQPERPKPEDHPAYMDHHVEELGLHNGQSLIG